ncbi:Uncharacterized protein GBIM_13528 [Gryllus bimaculatus]|nr:Uncharacterized protein GBIM_13528 [Gryllus bimaculatus]
MSRYSFGYLSSLLFHLYIYGCATALREVRLWVPEAVRSGHAVKLACDYDLEEAALYSIKWYRGDQEFYRYVPKESPPTRVFALPGIHVDLWYLVFEIDFRFGKTLF